MGRIKSGPILEIEMLHLMTIVLIVLKAMGFLAISWWLVFTPSIIAMAIVVIALLVVAWAN